MAWNVACLYAYYEKDDSYKSNFEYFLAHGLLPHVTYFIIISGSSSVVIPEAENVHIIRRENGGMDFGAYSDLLGFQDMSMFDYVFFINTSIRGPFLGRLQNNDWTRPFIDLFLANTATKLVGVSINVFGATEHPDIMEYLLPGDKAKALHPHVQSMFFALDRESLAWLLEENAFAVYKDDFFQSIVGRIEVGMSYRILSRGWNIDCLLENYRGRDYRCIDSNPNPSGTDPWWPDAYFGRDIVPDEAVFFKANRGVATKKKLHFVVGTCLQTQISCDLLHTCLKTLRRFHPDARTTVCIDNSNPDMVANVQGLFLHKGITWMDNPFPRSGEFGVFYVASHLEGCTEDSLIFTIHDSVCLRRAITDKELSFEFKPLWITEDCPATFHDDSPLPFVLKYILPAVQPKMADEVYNRYEKIMTSYFQVTFGVMVAGTPTALRRIWESGMDCIPPHLVFCRKERCRIERVVTLCARAAGFKTDVALCGNIFDHEENFLNVLTLPAWTASDTDVVPLTRPPFHKFWLGR